MNAHDDELDPEFIFQYIRDRRRIPLSLRKRLDADARLQGAVLAREDEIPPRTRSFGMPWEKVKRRWLGTAPDAGLEYRGGRFIGLLLRYRKLIYFVAAASTAYAIIYVMLFAGN